MSAIINDDKFKELCAEFGTVKYRGQTLALIQLPYASTTEETYEAAAITKKGLDEYEHIKPTHHVTWQITNENPEDCDDDSDMCDWDYYTVKKL